MLEQGEQPVVRELTEAEYLASLRAKLVEEAGELDTEDREGLLGELADLQAVLDCMAAAIGKTSAEIRYQQAVKTWRYGSFARRLYMEEVTIPDDNEWIAYLEANPERYPEVSD